MASGKSTGLLYLPENPIFMQDNGLPTPSVLGNQRSTFPTEGHSTIMGNLYCENVSGEVLPVGLTQNL